MMASTDFAKQTAEPDDAESAVIIALDPHRRGRQYARPVAYGRPIWAIIASLQVND